jgi:hypothetical protein
MLILVLWMWPMLPTFRRYMMPQSLGSKGVSCRVSLFMKTHQPTDFDREHRENTYLWNVGKVSYIQCTNPRTESASILNHLESLTSKDLSLKLSGAGVYFLEASRLPGFDPRSGHVSFMVDEVVFAQVFSEYFSFLCQFSFYRPRHMH